MGNKNFKQMAWTLLAGLALLPLSTQAQTIRGDFNMDGAVNIGDVPGMINYLLTGTPGVVDPADRDTITVRGETFVMVHVHGGTYSRSVVNVKTMDHDYWIAQTVVTQELWHAVTGDYIYGPIFPNNPMSYCNYEECMVFIDSLNALTGRQFRVPTEQEWEFAAYGGKLTMGYTYSGSNDINEVAWYKGNRDDALVYLPSYQASYYDMPVTSKAPNELGLYGMCGSVWEFTDLGLNDYCGLRGGDRSSTADKCLPTSSLSIPKTQKNGLHGLRLAM